MQTVSRKILLVDDDPLMVRAASTMLAAEGYTVTTALDGMEALRMAEFDPPDYLLTDWDMPGLDGLELCRRLRAMALPHYIYILFLTAKNRTEELVQGLEAGADDFVKKPVHKAELVARLRAGQRVLELERRLNDLARNDMLTGLLTRRAFLEALDKEFHRAQRYELPLACLIIDIDYFKRINDTFGHPAGDAVLKRVATLLADSCRKSDVVCRYGGEEFCVILPETTESSANIWAERVRKAVAELTFEFEGRPLKITASIGIAQRFDDTRSGEGLVDQSDQALLVAKQSGRDRTVRFSSLVVPGELNLEVDKTRDPFAGVQAKDVMTSPVACLRADETIAQAAEFFCRFRVNSTPVVNPLGKLVGILSEKDVMSVMLSLDSWDRPVSEVMKHNVVCYDEETPLRKIYEFLCRVVFRRVVIARDGYPTGVIGRANLLRWYQHWATANTKIVCEDLVQPTVAGSRLQLEITADALVEQSRRLRNLLDEEPENAVPIIVDGASRMQETINDLLSQSRLAVEETNATGAAVPSS